MIIILWKFPIPVLTDQASGCAFVDKEYLFG